MNQARCPGCRTRRATWQSLLAHVANTGHKACDCGMGYHHPHRPGSRGCAQEKLDPVFGEPVSKMHLGSEIPF